MQEMYEFNKFQPGRESFVLWSSSKFEKGLLTCLLKVHDINYIIITITDDPVTLSLKHPKFL